MEAAVKETQLDVMRNLLLKTITEKLEVTLMLSAIASGFVTFFNWTLDTTFLGVTVFLIIVTAVLIVIDFFLGNIASRYRTDYKGVESTKITYTFLKFLMFFLWLFLAYTIRHEMKDIKWFDYVLSAITSFPIFLVNLREFISIGENIEIIYKKKPYIFTLVDKLFASMEKLFLKRTSGEIVDEPTTKTE